MWLPAVGLWLCCTGTGCAAGSSREPAAAETVQNPAADTVSYMPYPRNMAGSYQIVPTSLQALQLPAFAREKVVFNLLADSTFQLTYFPLHSASEEDITRYELVNATGKWAVEKSEDGPHWYVLMSFDTIAQARSGNLLATGVQKINFLQIQDSVPPHSIHIPLFTNPAEIKTGVLLRKK